MAVSSAALAGPVLAPADAPFVSVVVPCYNAAPYVASAIQSVLDQAWPALEVIVVDDGSSDGSAARVRAAFPSLKVVEQVNQGVAAARNHGITQARGDWIAFLDADDIWLPGKLRAQFDALRAEPAARMACGAWQVWTSDAAAPPASYVQDIMAAASDSRRWTGPSGWIYPQLLLDCEVWTSTVLMHRSLLEEVGQFDTTLRVGEDYDLWLRASRVTPIVRPQRPVALYRQHQSNITRSMPEQNYRAVVVSRALARWGYADGQGSAADPAQVSRTLATSWSAFAGASLHAGQVGRAVRAAWMSLRTDPRHAGAWKTLAKALWRSLAPKAGDVG